MPTKWKRFLTYGSKTIFFGIVLALFFSPLNFNPAQNNGELSPHLSVTQAQTRSAEEIDCISRGGTWQLTTPGIITGEYACYGFGGYVLADGETSNNPIKDAQGDACNTITSCIAGIVYVFTVYLGSWVAFFAAWMLSLAIALSLQSTAYALDFLSSSWTIVRDIANMFFILILVYIAFTIMLRAETSDTLKKLAWVVVIALVINFSFFFTRVVIDTGNLMAIQFYNAIDGHSISESARERGEETNTPGNIYEEGAGTETKDLTAGIMDAIGIQTLLSNESFKAFQEQNNLSVLGSFDELALLVVIYIMVGAMYFMLAAAFFTVAVKFLFRIVVLWVVLFTSPVAFVANTVQQGKKMFGMWLNALISHSFYPAVFLFFFYILTLLVKGLRGTNETILGNIFSQLTPAGGSTYIIGASVTVAIYLGIVLLFLYICLKAADKIQVFGAEAANGFSRFATRIGSTPLGLPAFALRNTIGARAQQAYMNSTPAQRNTLWGRGLYGGLDKLRKGSFDVRNAPGVRPALRDVDYGLGAINYDVGTGNKAPRRPNPTNSNNTGNQEQGAQQTANTPLNGEVQGPNRPQPQAPTPRAGATIDGAATRHTGASTPTRSTPEQHKNVPATVSRASNTELEGVRDMLEKINKENKKMGERTVEVLKANAESTEKMGERVARGAENTNKGFERAAEALRTHVETVTPQASFPTPPPFNDKGGVNKLTKQEIDTMRNQDLIQTLKTR